MHWLGLDKRMVLGMVLGLDEGMVLVMVLCYDARLALEQSWVLMKGRWLVCTG